MLKIISLYILVMSMSLSIIGPSLSVIIDNDSEIEVVQDVEEEKNESKNELEEFEKFFDSFSLIVSEIAALFRTSNYYYLASSSGHIKDIHSPPPDFV